MQIEGWVIKRIEKSFLDYCRNVGLGEAIAEKFAAEALSVERVDESIKVLEKFCGTIKNKKLLEIGSGYGMFLVGAHEHFADVYGIEPQSTEAYEKSFLISRILLKNAGGNPDNIMLACGESIPFPDNFFDIVYSSSVLEHVANPCQVLCESLRVLKPGGYLQFVFPNYGSFWEGHFCIFWIPYLPHVLSRLYLRIMGRDPSYSDTLNFINYFSISNALKPYLGNNEIEIIGFGEEIFQERMLSIDFSSWGGLEKVKKWIRVAHRWKVIRILSWLMIRCKAYTPIILTLYKR